MPYLLDADTFIQAKNGPYRFSVCPAYWDWIDREHANGKIFSVQRIYDELMAREDDLSDWIEDRQSLFLAPDEATTNSLKVLTQWAIKNYPPEAYTEFFSSGDFLLVGHALGHSFIVVTHERSSNSQNKIKIPNACAPFIVECINPFELLQRENASFVLGS
ncbi:MAG: DUF4411 family protein [Candidatus Udaeobacter sp.]